MANQMIALGVEPVQTPNMLAQAADVLAVGDLMQQQQGRRGVQQAIAGGMSPSDPRLLQYGAQGQEAYSTAIAGEKAQLENADRRVKMIGGAAGYLRNNPTPDAFGRSIQTLLSNGVISPEEAQAATAEVGNDPARIKAYADRVFTQAIDAEAQIMRTYSQDIGGAQQVVGVDPLTGQTRTLSRTGKTVSPSAALAAESQANRLAFDQAKFIYEQQNPNRELQMGADGVLYGVDKRTLEAVPVTMGSPSANMLGQAQVGMPGAGEPTMVSEPTIAPERVPFMGRQSPQAFEREADRLGAKSIFEEAQTAIPAAQSAATSLPKLYETLDLLETGQPITGFGAGVLNDFERARAQFLQDKQAGQRVTDTEYLRTLLGSEVFPMIQQLGIGARGLDTPAEREFLLGVMTGDINMNAETLKRMLNFRVNTLEKSIDRTNDKIERGDFNVYFEGRRQDPQTIEKPTRQPAAPTQTGVSTATPPTVQSDEQYDALPSGALFLDPQGNTRRKP